MASTDRFNKASSINRVLIIALCLLLPAISWANTQFYRYYNENGILVISTRIPPEMISNGYDIVGSDGKLIQRVEPELNPTEKALLLQQQAEEKRQRALDQALIRRFSRVSDIENERDRKLQQINTDIRLRYLSVEKLDEEIARWQSIAADDERLGQEVSESTVDKLNALTQERLQVLATIDEKEMEKVIVTDQYQSDIMRFMRISSGR